jgi:dipeptidyl aminopeptidase/acylaminoacyl peptidase
MTYPALRCAALVIPFSLAVAALAQSGNPAPMTPYANPDPRLAAIHASMGRVEAPGQVAISPDGSTIAYTLRGREGATLHLISATDPDPAKEKIVAPDAATACSNISPIWAPDSQTLAYTSTCTGSSGGTQKREEPGQEQIFLWNRASGISTQLTHLKGLFEQPTYSPDGKTLAFLFVENATRSAGALAAMTPWSGVIGQDHVEIQRVALVDVANGLLTFATPANLHVYEFGWAPDSHLITFTAANPPGENNWWVAKLYTESLTGQPQVIFDPATTTTALKGLQIAVPRFSPDGRRIAFIGGIMSDQGSTGGDIWVVNARGGEPTDITPGIDGTPTWEAWLNPSTVGFLEDRSGRVLLNDASADRHMVVPGTADDLGEVNITGGPIKMAVSSTRSGEIAFVESGHNQPPEIFAGKPGALKQITHFNDGAKPPVRTESIEWANEGFHIQGWLTYPKNYDDRRKYPLLVDVHGGPSASASAHWGGSVWAELGYFVFAPNPRGSFGQGEKFTSANIKDFGYGDLRDILAGMDAVEKKVSVDRSREGLTGWSYGGFMTMFAVTQTHRFRAAVAGAGLSDWLSYYGENSIDQWMLPFFGATVYNDPAVYAKSSAITYIKNVKTPTLVIVGDRDGECPAPQSFEFWHALRAEGVKTELVVYPNEGHGFRDPAHIRDREAREVGWFEQYMPVMPGDGDMPAKTTAAQ